MNTTMAWASAAGFSLLHSLWELALIALLAALQLSRMNRASASARHAVGMAWLVAMAAAPVITFAFYWHAMAPEASTGTAWFAAHAEVAATAPTTWPASNLSSWLLVCCAQVWMLGVALMTVRQFGGWRALHQIEQAPSVPLPPAWLQRFEKLRRAMGVSR